MLECHIRPAYQKWLVDPVAAWLSPYLSPNAITALSLAMGLVAAVLVAFGSTWAAVLCLLLSGFLDTLDGTVARLSGRSTPYGAMFDIVCDRLVELAVILGLFALDPGARALPCLLMLGSVLMVVTTFLTAGIFIPNDSHKSFNYTPGLMERPEAFTFFALLIFFPAVFGWLSALFSLLVLYTAGLRMVQARRILLAEQKGQSDA